MIVVVWHGINSDCCSDGVARVITALQEALPKTYIKSIKIGDSLREDFLRSFFGNVNDQIEMVWKDLRSDPELAHGFNAVGISQVLTTVCFFLNK
jgi:palmitoyl-protein thioesterase